LYMLQPRSSMSCCNLSCVLIKSPPFTCNYFTPKLKCCVPAACKESTSQYGSKFTKLT
jgi:hypothetical protein